MRRYLVLLLLLVISGATAIGVAPGKLEIVLNSGQTSTFTFHIVNNLNINMTSEVYVTGDLEDYVKTDVSSVELEPGEIKAVEFEIWLPDDYPNGIYVTNIGASEVVENVVGSGFNARISSEGKLIVKNLKGSVKIGADLEFQGGDVVGEPIKLILHLENPSTKDLENIQAKVTVYDFNNIGRRLLYFPKLDLKSQSSDETSIEFDTSGLMKGTYKAKVEINYGEAVEELEEYFLLGKPFVEILNVNATKSSNLLKIESKVQNQWSETLKDVYGEAKVLYQGNVLGVGITNKADLEPGQIETLKTFIDVGDRPISVLDIDFIVYYEDYYSVGQYSSNLEGEVKGLGAVVAREELEKGEEGLIKYSNYLILALLLLMLVALYIYNKPRKRSEIAKRYYKPKSFRRYAK
jgi:hypothetical protein